MIGLVLAVWNLLVFLLYGLDKWKAETGRWRIRESVLIGCAWLLGGIGAVCGMAAFHHKVSKMKFRILVPLAVAWNLAVVYVILPYF